MNCMTASVATNCISRPMSTGSHQNILKCVRSFLIIPRRSSQCRNYLPSAALVPDDCKTLRFSAGNSCLVQFLNLSLFSSHPLRNFHGASTVCMGRRSSKIATRKGTQDAKKAKMYGKIGKLIVSTVKAGGPSPTANSALALLLNQARLYDVPKDIVERNIKRATEKGQADFVEANYEVYGVGGVGIVLEVLTDNNARAAANVRDVVKKSGCKMADPGSVLFNFQRCGVVAVKAEGMDADELLLAAMDAGADDVREPESNDEEEDDSLEHGRNESFYKILVELESFASVKEKLEKQGIPIIHDNSGLELMPLNLVEVDDEARNINISMIEKLLELDDVDAVYSNLK